MEPSPDDMEIDPVPFPDFTERPTVIPAPLIPKVSSDIPSEELQAPTTTTDQPSESLSETAVPPSCPENVLQLHSAISKGKLDEVQQILQQSPDPSSIISHQEPVHGQTALMVAVKAQQWELVRQFCGTCTPVEYVLNIQDLKGNTCLHFAATKNYKIVHYLLEKGADPSIINQRSMTPVMTNIMTMQKEDDRTLRCFLKFGAKVDLDETGSKPLHAAIDRRLFKIAGALITAGARLDMRDDDGQMAFQKVNRTVLRGLLGHIYFPPTLLNPKEFTDCMICDTKIGFGHRKNNCTHCGRIACTPCSKLTIPFVQFPKGFPGRITGGAKAVKDEKKVCKTCYNLLKDQKGESDAKGTFYQRVMNIEWDEVNPNMGRDKAKTAAVEKGPKWS